MEQEQQAKPVTETDVKRIIVEMFQKGEIRVVAYGNPNVGLNYAVHFDICEDDYYFSGHIDLDV